MHVLGLTGGIGSGKSTVAGYFSALGVHWVDADNVAREVVEPGTQALKRIEEHFGPDILTHKGELDRASLRTIIFKDDQERLWLEQLLHPIIRREIERQLKPAGYALPYVLLVSPLLLETDQHELVEQIIVVDVPEETQIDRTVSRDENSREQVQRILDAQMKRQERLARANHVIDNTEAPGRVERQVQSLHQQLMDDLGGAR